MPRLNRWTYLVVLACLCIFNFASSARSAANAFATPISKVHTSATSVRRSPFAPPTEQQDIMAVTNRKPAADTALATASGGDQKPDAKPAPPKRIRIEAFDSMRFFLIAFICIGHFIRFAHPSSPIVMNLFSQVNVVVGAFFVLSGYVTAYTSTTVGAYESSPKLKPAPGWILPRIFGYFPLHVIVLALFSPMFLFADVKYNGWFKSIGHGLMSLTMTQAWFPQHAEVWNAPAWFLSALTFATAIMPFALPPMSQMTKQQLRRVVGYITMASLLPKLGYSYDHNVWGVMEGITAPKNFPNLAMFNIQRFNPFFNMLEVMLGAVACRLVMLDGVEDPNDKTSSKVPQTNLLSTLLPAVGMVGILVLRAMDILKLNDLLTRTLLFMPLFLKFIMATHRVAVANANSGKKDNAIVQFLSSKGLVLLGGLSFPMFLVHGPLGQLFYKKLIATKLFGGTLDKVYGPWFFGVYLAAVVGSAAILKKLVMDNPKIGSFSKTTAGKWAKGL